MIMIRSIVRPEKVDDVLAALMDAVFPAVSGQSGGGNPMHQPPTTDH